MEDSYTIWKAITLWFNGEELNKEYTIHHLSVLWIGRYGQLLQFIAALTIIAEIIGRTNVKNYKERLDSFISIRQSFKFFVKILKLVLYSLIYGTDIRNQYRKFIKKS